MFILTNRLFQNTTIKRLFVAIYEDSVREINNLHFKLYMHKTILDKNLNTNETCHSNTPASCKGDVVVPFLDYV
jgi:hypothetical protein